MISYHTHIYVYIISNTYKYKNKGCLLKKYNIDNVIGNIFIINNDKKNGYGGYLLWIIHFIHLYFVHDFIHNVIFFI